MSRPAYDAALTLRRVDYYLRLGMALTPVEYGDKLPVFGKGWNKRENLIYTREQAERWFRRPHNIGIPLGASRIISFDGDDLELARADFAARGLDLDSFINSHPYPIKGNGIRLWFREPEDCPINSRRALQVEGVTAYEIRGGNGFQDVAPGSLHPKGFFYTWAKAVPRRREDLPELPPFLVELWEALNDKPEKASKPASARALPAYSGPSVIDTFNARITVEEILERNGYKRRGDRYLGPNSRSNLAAVVLYQDGDKTRAKTYHTSDCWHDNHGHDAFDLFCTLEYDGNLTAALDAARGLLGMERPQPAAPKLTPTDPKSLWAAHGAEVLNNLMDRLAAAKGHQRSRQKYMDLLVALWSAVDEGCLTVRNGKTLIEFGGLAVLAERMLYRGRLHDLRAGLDYLCTIGMIGRVTSTNPEDRFAPLAVEVTADPRHLPALTFPGALTLKSSSWDTLHRRAAGTAETKLHTTKRKPGNAVVCNFKTPLHDARFVLYWIGRGATSPEDVARMGRLRLATVKRHLRALEEAGLIVDFRLTVSEAEAQKAIRLEVESDPAYRAARARYLEKTLSFGARGSALAARFGAPRLQARRHATFDRAHIRLTRLLEGESCAAVFGLEAA